MGLMLVLGTAFFVLGLCCTFFQVSLYSWTVGNLVTSAITVLLAVLCSLPGFFLVSTKWYPKPFAMERRDANLISRLESELLHFYIGKLPNIFTGALHVAGTSVGAGTA